MPNRHLVLQRTVLFLQQLQPLKHRQRTRTEVNQCFDACQCFFNQNCLGDLSDKTLENQPFDDKALETTSTQMSTQRPSIGMLSILHPFFDVFCRKSCCRIGT